MDRITIKDLAVLCRIGVPDEERAKPQRLLITIWLGGDFGEACESDDIGKTFNYFDVSRRVVEFCRAESFKLIEKLAHEIAGLVLREFNAETAAVEVKKFILSDARWVSFKRERSRSEIPVQMP
jgi:FolB domain-containing protein